MTLREDELSVDQSRSAPMVDVLMGRLSPIECRFLSPAAIGLWKMFSDLDLSDARKSRFVSFQDCFIRELKPGARPSPGPRDTGEPLRRHRRGVRDHRSWHRAAGERFPYTLTELLNDASFAQVYEGGQYVTLRITPTMYHRFHAPHDLEVEHVTYVSGDTWNVYPIALRKVQRLFCRNERAILRCRLSSTGTPIALVPSQPFLSPASVCTARTCCCT